MWKLRSSFGVLAAVGTAVLFSGLRPAAAASYNVTFNDGNEGSWNTVYAQGFNTALGASANSASPGDTVDLTQFQFFKSGSVDTATNIQLAIFNTLFPNTVGLTTSSSNFVGLSSNTIATTAAILTGGAETFTFNNLPLIYGSANDYSAYFVNVDGSGNITPVQVSALTVNYAVQPDTQFHPVTNYGTESQFQYATGNFINGGFLQDFSFAGDAAFSATFSTVPEPASLGILSLAVLAGMRRRRSH